MQNRQEDKELQRQVKMLNKELERIKLKAEALEAMIIVAEEELKIKIRKKNVVPNSLVECGKATQR